jgi:hypothetical protein
MTLSSACAITVGAAYPRPLVGTTIWKYGASGIVSEAGSLAAEEYVAVTRFTGTLQ